MGGGYRPPRRPGKGRVDAARSILGRFGPVALRPRAPAPAPGHRLQPSPVSLPWTGPTPPWTDARGWKGSMSTPHDPDSDHAALVTRFYEAFQRRDADTMAACYHPQATFSDPAFPDLRGDQPGAMWRMLCHRGRDLRIEFSDVHAEGPHATAHWEARYSFGPTGRPVHNVIDARFRFQDGLIIEHVDRFDFWRWSRQALGLSGLLLGWTGLLQRAVQRQAMAGLEEWMAGGRPPASA